MYMCHICCIYDHESKVIIIIILLYLQLADAKIKREREMADLQLKIATKEADHVTEGDDQEGGETAAASEFTMEGLTGVGSEMDRVHIAEKNKAMAAKLKVRTCVSIIAML